MIKAPERIEIPEEEDLRRERFARILAVLIVLATLGVASVEYLHSMAEKNADAAGIEAQRLSIERQGEIVRANDVARANVDIYAYEQQQRTEQGNAFQEYLSPSVTSGSSQAQLLQLEQTRWQTLASLTGQLTSVKDTGATSPASDPGFPNALLAASEKNADRLFALGDAQDQLRADWLGQTGRLSVVLTLLAVAIYLFGLSLTLQARVRRWLVGLGVVLVAVGAVGTIALQFANPSTPSEAAADSYADGMYALNTFYTRPGDEGLKDAYNSFSQAIQQRPRFAQAYLQRSKVQFLLGSPERTSSLVSVTTPSALRAASDDLQHAYDLGLRNKDLLNNLAANELLVAVTQNQSGQLNPAINNLNAALKLDPNDPILYYNKALALLAQGDTSQAQQQYQLAAQHTVYTDIDKKTPRGDPAIEDGDVAGALTDLDLLSHYRGDLSAQVTSMKELVVNGVDRTFKPQGQTAKVNISAVDVFPAELQWSAAIDGVDITKSDVSTEWYYQDPQKLGWSVIGGMSGASAVATQSSAQTHDNTVYQQVCNSCQPDDYFLINSSLKNIGECLQPGQYRVDVYVNGRLAGTKTATQTYQAMQAERMPDLSLDFCHPQDWQVPSDHSNVIPGFSNAFTTADGASGAFFARFQNPGVTPADATAAKADAQQFRDNVLKYFTSVLPSNAGTPTLDCGTNGQLPWGPSVDSGCNRTDSFFLGLKGANEAWYTYSGGEMHAGAGFTSDGAIVVGFTFGPSSQWQSATQANKEPLADQVFDSVVITQQ